MYIDETCGFCAEIHSIPSDNNLLLHHITPNTGLTSRVITQTEHFVVIPTLGSFVEGYVMVLSKAHYDCAGQIPADQMAELTQLLEMMKNRIRQCYHTDTVCFEHGSVSCTNRFGGCINHAHIHIVPCPNSLMGEIALYDLQTEKIDSLEDLQGYGQRGEPYLYFEDTDQQKYLITGDNVVSQFFRKLLAQQHGVDEKWDWRTDLCMENVQKTCQRLSEEFAYGT